MKRSSYKERQGFTYVRQVPKFLASYGYQQESDASTEATAQQKRAQLADQYNEEDRAFEEEAYQRALSEHQSAYGFSCVCVCVCVCAFVCCFFCV
jgi:hypothetical protein